MLESDIKLGDKIRIKETGKTYNISSILIKGKKLNEAKEGDSVGLELKFATKNSVKRGMTIIQLKDSLLEKKRRKIEEEILNLEEIED